MFFHYFFCPFWILMIIVSKMKQTVPLFGCDLTELLKIAIILLMALSFIFNLKKCFWAWYCLLFAYSLMFPLIFAADPAYYQSPRGDPLIAFTMGVILGAYNLIIKRTQYIEYLKPECCDDSETESI